MFTLPAPRLSVVTAVIAFTAAITFLPQPPAAGATESVQRTYGGERITTAVAASAEHRAHADDVLLATAEDFPDALAAGALAADLDAPVLLTAPESLPAVVRTELARLATRRVWVLGGPRAVGEEVVETLRADGYEVHRLADASRYGTARAVALRAGAPTGEAVVALGEHPEAERAWADAVAAGALAAAPGHVPTLLTRADDLPPETAEALAELGVRRVLLLGGTAAVGPAVEQHLRELGYDVRRVAGASRYDTSIALADMALERFGAGAHPVVFASGRDFPDALAAGAVAAAVDGPLVLVPPANLGGSTDEWLRQRKWAEAVVVGGPASASDRVVAQLDAAVRNVPVLEAAVAPEPQQPAEQVVRVFQGMASWYGPGFHGATTASGEPFDRHAMTAAHRTLPFGTRVRVTNLATGGWAVVRINDRGPFHGNRVIDLAEAAAEVIGMKATGTATVRVEVLAG